MLLLLLKFNIKFLLVTVFSIKFMFCINILGLMFNVQLIAQCKWFRLVVSKVF